MFPTNLISVAVPVLRLGSRGLVQVNVGERLRLRRLYLAAFCEIRLQTQFTMLRERSIRWESTVFSMIHSNTERDPWIQLRYEKVNQKALKSFSTRLSGFEYISCQTTLLSSFRVVLVRIWRVCSQRVTLYYLEDATIGDDSRATALHSLRRRV